jgi:hypothetical protein
MKKVFAIFVILICLCGLSFGQQRSEVFDMGDGFIGQVINTDSEKALLVQFPESALDTKEDFQEATKIAIYKVFVDTGLVSESDVLSLTTGSDERGRYIILTIPNGTEVFIFLLDNEQGKIVGLAFVYKLITFD